MCSGYIKTSYRTTRHLSIEPNLMLFVESSAAWKINNLVWLLQATADAKKAATSKFDEKEDPSAGLMNVSS
jgi:hypothetical protein